MQTFTYITPFEVPQGQEDEFRRQWNDTTELLSRAPGFLASWLYEVSSEIETYVQQHIFNMKRLEQRFRFTSIAEWASIEHFEAAMRSPLVEAKTISFPSYPAPYHLLGGLDKPTEHPPRTGRELTFIVPFEVPEGQEEEMRRQFRAVVEGMERKEGSLGPGLYELDKRAGERLQNMLSGQVARTPFSFINVAEWASIEHYEAAMRSRRDLKPISFMGHGTYYRLAAEYKRSAN